MAVYVFSFLFLLSPSFRCFIIVLTIIRGPEAVITWPGSGGPWGFWEGVGGSQWGSEVEGEESGELGLAQLPRDRRPHSLSVLPHSFPILPTSIHLLSFHHLPES